jgi:hypothetical protein
MELTMTIQQFLTLMDRLKIPYVRDDKENFTIMTKNGDYRIHVDLETLEIYPLTIDEEGDYHPISQEELIEKLK